MIYSNHLIEFYIRTSQFLELIFLEKSDFIKKVQNFDGFENVSWKNCRRQSFKNHGGDIPQIIRFSEKKLFS
jgi:hypothetical protein